MSWSVVRPCVRPSVRALTFSLNISETTYRIFMKFHRNVPTMVLFRIYWNNLIPSKTLVAMATKLIFFKSLKVFLSGTIRPRATKFGMYLCLMGLYQVSSNNSPGVNFYPAPGVTSFTWDYIGKTLEVSLYLAIRPRLTKFCMYLYLVSLY